MKNMSQDFIRDQFIKVFNNKINSFSPNVIEYGNKGSLMFELSKGREFMDITLYGVTVLILLGDRPLKTYDKSQAFATLEEARKYIETL